MKKLIYSMFIIFIFIPQLFAQEVGKIKVIQGKVDIIREGKPPAMEAKLNQSIYPKDIIKTKTSSKVEIAFKDGTVIKIGQRSRVDISEYLLEGPILKAKIDLQQGRVEAYVSKDSVDKINSSPKANRFEIRTPIAVAGVRGTDFIVSHDANLTTTVIVISGKVYAYNINIPDQIIELQSGEMTIIKGINLPKPPFPITPQYLDKYQKTINYESLTPPITETIPIEPIKPPQSEPKPPQPPQPQEPPSVTIIDYDILIA